MRNFILMIAIIIVGSVGSASAQLALPYQNSFDNISFDTVGWSHRAITGTDDWAIGAPTKYYLNSANTQPNAWVTDLTNGYAGYAERILETPAFDLSNTSINYALSFFQERQSASAGAFYYLEYSTDGGISWQLLDDATVPKKNWQGVNGFLGNVYGSFQHSSIKLSFIQGQANVKFRFRFVTNYPNGDGWMIDDFGIQQEYFNMYATPGDSIFVSQNCSQFNVTSTLGFYNQYSQSVNNTTDYYFSRDSILDATDDLVATKSSSINESVNNWTQPVDMIPNLNVGYYYIIYKHDALNVLAENNETDNTGYAVLKIDSVFSLPFTDDFENSFEPWKTSLAPGSTLPVWELGSGYRHHLEGAHSGTKAWHTSKSIQFDHWNCGNGCNVQYVESNFIDLTSMPGNLVLNLWYKANVDFFNYTIEYSDDCGNFWTTLYTFSPNRNDEWDFVNVPLNTIPLINNIKFRIRYAASYLQPEGIIFDDIYIGNAKPDLSIENDKSNHFTPGALNSTTLNYYLNNSGLAPVPQTTTTFYWSTDSLLDASDILLGSKQEPALADTQKVWTSFTFTKPSTATGRYFIIYVLDAGNVVNEMRENGNQGYFTLYQNSLVGLPYFNDFNTQTDGWRHNASLGVDDWQWSVAHGNLLDSISTGTKGWITKDTGLVSPMSRMHLYSPIFDFSALTNPVMEFDMKLHSDGSCNCFEGKTNMSYSTDGGATWIILDTTNQSYNRWYYPMDYNTDNGLDYNYDANYTQILFDYAEPAFAAYNQYNSRDAKRTTRYILDLRFLAGTPQIQFRYNLATLVNNDQSPNYPVEGAFVDNFQIRESFVDVNVDYKKALMQSSKAEKIKFFMQIKNQGNYISLPGITKFYVSSDTTLDVSDVYLGQVSIPSIRPDMYYYLNNDFDAPSNLGNYHYLLYELDASNTNPESNEVNNKGYWPLALDSIRSYPYYNNFNDSIVNGWHHYSMNWSNTLRANYRIRNMISPGEPIYQTDVESGQLFTERVPSGNFNSPPYFFLETPAFDFSRMDSIQMSFDLMCTGSVQSDGGNFSFSIDGGNTWNVLTSAYGQSFHWYNNTGLSDLDNEPGWAFQPPAYAVSQLDSTAYDLSFLRGKKDVVFRFKYKSNLEVWGGGTVQGLRIDNFRINGFESDVDYVANDSMVAINSAASQPDIAINYSITNAGPTSGRATATKFYWSADSILNAADTLIQTVSESPVMPGATLSGSTIITYPLPVSQAEYYLFYVADADSSIVETNENNNAGSFKISFQPFTNYTADVQWRMITTPSTQPAFNIDYSIINNGTLDGTATITNFYWSADSILDAGDPVIRTVNEVPVLSGNTLSATIDITYPTPLIQQKYYLFYKADDGNSISESNENDNVGSYIIEFQTQPNYYANIAGDTIHAVTTNPAITVPYSIVNNSAANAPNSSTAFYWSSDNILDSGDQLLYSSNEPPIVSGDTLFSSANLIYPVPVAQPKYFLFYKADNANNITETNEIDNTGMFEINFSPASVPDSSGLINMYVFGGRLYVVTPATFNASGHTLKMVDIIGNTAFSINTVLSPGVNTFLFPPVAGGIYIVSLYNRNGMLIKKYSG